MFIISNNYRAIYVYNTCLKYSLIILNLILTANWDMDSVMTATLEMIKKWENEFEVTEQTKKKKNETGVAILISDKIDVKLRMLQETRKDTT